MPREVNLLTSIAAFDRLHKLADGKGVMVSVERDKLSHLLVDHSVLVTACKGAAIRVLEPMPRRERAKLSNVAVKPLKPRG
jgi:hypothetical protein